MEEKERIENEDSLWAKGDYIRSIDTNDPQLPEKSEYIEDNLESPKEFNCKKCNAKIGKHNLYWHEGMCNECFFDTYFPEENDN